MSEKDFDIELEIRSIMWGKWIVQTNSEDPAKSTLLLRYPTIDELMICDFEYRSYIQDHKSDLPSQKEVENIALLQGLWSHNHDKAIDRIQEQLVHLGHEIEHYKIKAKKAVGFRAQVRSLQKQIKATETALQKLVFERNSIFCNTLEFHANKQKVYQIVKRVTEYTNGSPVWGHGDMNEEYDIELIDFLIDAYLTKINALNVSRIRQVARDGQWRFRWRQGKDNIQQLFGRDIRDLSDEQNLLMFWSQVYDSIYEAVEPVPDHVINNDEKLDEYLKSKYEERKQKANEAFYKIDQQQSGNEIFVNVDGYYDKDGYWQEYTEEEKKKIADAAYNKNVPLFRRMQQRAHNVLHQSDEKLRIHETKLRNNTELVALGWDKLDERNSR